MKKVLVLVAVLAFVGAAQGANALLNGSFEDGFSNWTQWAWGNAPAIPGNPSISTDAYEGVASCQGDTGAGTWGGGCGVFQGVYVGGNQNVSMSGYLKGVPTGGFVGIDMVFFAVAPTPESMDPPSIGRVELAYSSFGPADAQGWQFGILSAVTPAATTYMKFEFSDNGNPGPSPILFDNAVGTIPEPMTLALLGLGGLMLRRKK